MTTEEAIQELELWVGRFRFVISGCAVPEVGCPELLRYCEAMELAVLALRDQREGG